MPPKIVPHISGLHDHAAALLDLLPAGGAVVRGGEDGGGSGGGAGRAAGPGRWLLVFDNAEDPADVTPWLPGRAGPGRARSPGCAEIRYRPMALLLLYRWSRFRLPPTVNKVSRR